MRFSIPAHPYGALSLPASGPEERRAQALERMARLRALDPEQSPMALAFLSGYHPASSMPSSTWSSRAPKTAPETTRQTGSRFA
jgi:hypothetical protein